LKRAKKFLPYIDIGEANKMMARAKKQKKMRWGKLELQHNKDITCWPHAFKLISRYASGSGTQD
jgi:hypothetical protein